MRQGLIYPTAWRSSEWLNLKAFLGTADCEVHIVYINYDNMAYMDYMDLDVRCPQKGH